jgi:hypothetical protein
MSSAGGRPSWQAMVSIRNFHRSARTPPAAQGHAGASPAATTPQITAIIHDFAAPLLIAARNPGKLRTLGVASPKGRPSQGRPSR